MDQTFIFICFARSTMRCLFTKVSIFQSIEQRFKITSDDISIQLKSTFIALKYQEFALKKKKVNKNICYCLPEVPELWKKLFGSKQLYSEQLVVNLDLKKKT